MPYYTMPFVRGASLRERMMQGPMAVAESLDLLRDVAHALAYALAQGVVHRDIKPENTMLSSGTAVVMLAFAEAASGRTASARAAVARAMHGAGSYGQAGYPYRALQPDRVASELRSSRRARRSDRVARGRIDLGDDNAMVCNSSAPACIAEHTRLPRISSKANVRRRRCPRAR